MLPFLLLVAAGIGWGLWSGKLMLKQLPPLALVIADASRTVNVKVCTALAPTPLVAVSVSV